MLQTNQWVDPIVKDCYHYYSDGTACSLLFGTDEEYVQAMNMAAALSILYGIKILAICLLNNHFHLVLKGRRANCAKFRDIYKRQIARYIRSCERKHLRVTMDPITTESRLRTLIIYVQRNCIGAGYAYLPQQYPWGTGNIFMVPEESFPHGIRVGSLSPPRARQFFRTHVQVPKEWEYDSKGMLMTQYWIDWQFVNYLFGTPRRYMASMHLKKDDAMAITSECRSRLLEDLSQKELRKLAADRFMTMVRKPASQCSLKERVLVAQKIWASTCGYSLKSIARATHVDPEVLRLLVE